MEKGYFLPVLHAHLPFVRHPEHEFFLEENWLFEAALDCYIPLIQMLRRLAEDKVDFAITISLSPTLLEMLSDGMLIGRLQRHISRLVSLAEKEVSRTAGRPELRGLALMYLEKWSGAKEALEDDMGCDIIGAFRNISELPEVEFITTSATHAFLPNLMPVPAALRAQLEGGMRVFERHMGFRPEGFWLPECGYSPGIDREIRNAGVEYFFLETHGVLHASPRPRYGIFRPLICPSGAVAFGRDTFAAERVWCAESGYPADPVYRDFFDDMGFGDPPPHVREHLKPMIHEDHGAFTGIKYKKITGQDMQKQLYDPGTAVERASLHAEDFVRALGVHVSALHEKYGFSPLVTAPYDAELFGHWWFEGPLWLEEVLRLTSGKSGRNVISITPKEYISRNRSELQEAAPSMSSWGRGGYSAIWTEARGGQIAARLLFSARRLKVLLVRGSKTGDAGRRRAMDLAMRELLLAQASDWTFMMDKGSHSDYASGRIEGHLRAFDELIEMVEGGHIDLERLSELEAGNRFMRDVGTEILR